MRSALAGIALGCFLCIGGCERKNGGGAAIDPVLAHMISPDTKVLAEIKMDQLRGTGFYQRHQSELDFPLLKSMADQLGFDPVRDLSSGLVTWDGKDVVIAGKGRFQRNDIEKRMAETAPPVKYKNHLLFGKRANVVAFLDQGVLVAGALEPVERAIDAHDNHEGRIPEELAERLRLVPKAAQIRVVSRGGLPFGDMPMRSDYASLLSNLAGYVGTTSTGFEVGSGVQLQAEIVCISEQGARRVNDALRGGLGLARLSTKDNELELLRLWDAFQIRKDNQTVRVNADLAGDLSDQLLSRVLSIGQGHLHRPT